MTNATKLEGIDYPDTFHPKMSVVSRVIPKKDFQSLLKTFRTMGDHVVTKISGGYTVHYEYQDKSKALLVLKAMNGSKGYLVRHADKLIQIL